MIGANSLLTDIKKECMKIPIQVTFNNDWGCPGQFSKGHIQIHIDNAHLQNEIKRKCGQGVVRSN